MNELTPILLFVYNRPVHTARLLDSLKKNYLSDRSTLYIISDGPKEGASVKQIEAIHEVRKIIRAEKWCKENILIEKEKNDGLANSITKAVTQVLNDHGKVIVLEDDLELSPYFLEYMNAGLTAYEYEEKVMSISGYMFPLKKELPENFFLRFDASWGWATWKRAWAKFEPDATVLIKELESKNVVADFNFHNSSDFFAMLKAQRDGIVDSWAIRWYASIYLARGLTFYPKRSFVLNTGHDGTGIHSEKTNKFDPGKLASREIIYFPKEVHETSSNREQIANYHEQLESPGLFRKIKTKLLKLVSAKNEKMKQ